MATRAGSGTGMLVSLVVFVVATVTLLVVSIVLSAGKSKAEEARETAEAELAKVITAEERGRDVVQAMLAEAAGRRSLFAEMTGRDQAIATFVAGNANASLEQMRRDLGIDGDTTVRSTLNDARGRARRLDQELESARADAAAANDEVRTLEERIDAMTREHREALAASQDTIAEYAASMESLRRRTEEAVAEIDDTRGRIEDRYSQRVRDLESQIDQLNEDNAVLRTRVGELDKKVNEVRPKPQSPAELVDGEIIDVVGGDRQVFLNLGRADRIVPGITFEVYGDARGISPDPSTGEYPRGKASIQVIKVGDVTSTARIVRDTASPVIPGDVVANAVFDPDTEFKFLIFGKFDVDGDGRPTTAEAEFLSQQVRDWGGVVVSGEELTGDLDFLVLGVQPPQPGPLPPNATSQQIEARLEAQDAFDRYDRLFRRATEAQIPILNANRFEVLTGTVRR